MKYFLIIFLTLSSVISSAQQITIDLSHFAGKEYVWFVSNGEKQDTIGRGSLNAKGQAVLTVPAEYRNWRGMSNFVLTDGGGLEIILNSEKDFIAGCTVAQPTANDIYYTGSAENSFLMEKYKLQPDLLNKAGIVAAAMQAYAPDEPLYKPLSEEKKALEKRFANLQRQSAESPLYAARIWQIADYCNGIDSRLDLSVKESMEEQRRYVREVLDFRDLWYSGMWKSLLARWMSVVSVQGDSVLLSDTKAMLTRVQDRDMRLTLLKKMVSLYNQYGKENLLIQLGEDIMHSVTLLSPGDQAPKLYLPDSTTIVPFNSLVIFYESGCGNCENDLIQLRGNYPLLQEKNIRVISVSADTDESIYRQDADIFPWQQKLCDYKGFEGVNFRNYAVVGTPTIFVIDSKGIITGRYAMLEEVLKELNN